MIKTCNYFADPLGDPRIICYDSETQRSARREETAAKLEKATADIFNIEVITL